ncbi:uncharacterized protein JCM10292_006360 [Rhodotorula paludigena]|uniref:uncharacterized protein n=1 Tax=Rhodotorula paludigena TaxID=86838 RepID=UPI0031702113
MAKKHYRACRRPAQAAPASSAPSVSPPDVPLASLAGLPPELKREIVETLVRDIVQQELLCIDGEYADDEGDGDEMDVGFFEKRDTLLDAETSPAVRDALLDLSLINRAFRAVCAPLIWEHLDIARIPLPSLQRLKSCLPKYADFVKSIVFDTPAWVNKCNSGHHKKGNRAHGPACLSKGDKRVVERANLVAAFIRACPGALDLHCVTTTPTEAIHAGFIMFTDEPRTSFLKRTRVLGAAADLVKARSQSLSVLEVEYRAVPATLLNYLAPSASLVSLELVFDHMRQPEAGDFPRLLPSLSALPALRHLSLHGSGWMTEEYLIAPPKLALVSLELSDDRLVNIRFAQLHTLLMTYSSTLEELNLRLDSAVEPAQPVDPQLDFHLPRLKALAIWVHFDEAFFLCFVSNPSLLAKFRIGPCHGLEPGLETVLAFIDAHKTTLDRVHLDKYGDGGYEQPWLDPAEIESLAAKCAESDIRLTGAVPEDDFDRHVHVVRDFDPLDYGWCLECDGAGCEDCNFGRWGQSDSDYEGSSDDDDEFDG